MDDDETELERSFSVGGPRLQQSPPQQSSRAALPETPLPPVPEPEPVPAPLTERSISKTGSPLARTSSKSGSVACSPLSRSSSKNGTVFLRTTSGHDIALEAPEHLRELQCRVCSGLIEGAVHAPCGHSFCQVHLKAAVGEQNELDAQAQFLRVLTVENGFSMKRSRQALAATGRGSIEQAVTTCQELSGLEGRAVRVRSDVKNPTFNWGPVNHSMVGVVTKDEDSQAWVSFPDFNSWHCMSEELEIDPVSDRVRIGSRVKVRSGIVPKQGWGPSMQADDEGTVVFRLGAQVILLLTEGRWLGHIHEVEVVEEKADPVAAALERLWAAKPSAGVLAQMHAFLLQIGQSPDAADVNVVVGGEDYATFTSTHGTFDLFRAVGLYCARFKRQAPQVFVFKPLPEVNDVTVRAQDALGRLKDRFTELPEPATPANNQRYKVVLTVDPSVFHAGIPVELVYREQLQPLILPAVSPPGETWTWPQRGWESEKEMFEHLSEFLPTGTADICRDQREEDAKLVAQRLQINSLQADVVKGKIRDYSVEACNHVVRGWVGEIPFGARVRFTEAAKSILPASINLQSIATVCGQYFRITKEGRTMYYFVNIAKGPNLPPFSESMLELAPAAERIQPGVRVRVHPSSGGEPIFGWGRIQGSDVGVVQRTRATGEVDVFFMTEEDTWTGSFQDLDTENLPDVVRADCPVCHKPFPTGQQLNVDIAMDAQIRRMQKLMAGTRLERNDGSIGAGKEKSDQLLRSQTHLEELKCNICFDLVVAPVTLPCGHTFCKHHIQVWLMTNEKCPVCRIRVMQCKDDNGGTLRPRCVLRSTAMFQTSLEDEDAKGGAGQESERAELCVNKMLESQVIRFFPVEVLERTAEVAAEVWETIVQRQEGCLARLRNFLRQFRGLGIAELLKLDGVPGPDVGLPSTKGSTLLMLSSELGLEDVVEELLSRKADPTKTTDAGFGPGTSALQLAAGQGQSGVLRQLLHVVEWTDELVANALGVAIERDQVDCVALLLEKKEIAEVRNCIDLTALLTAVQAGNAEIISCLVERSANLEARTVHSGLLVSKAGCAKVNGPYQQVGELNERPLYANRFGAVVYCRSWWKIAASQQDIEKDDENEQFLYSMPSPRRNSPEPSTGQWTTAGVRPIDGRPVPEPAPVMEALAKTGQAATPLLLAAQLGLGIVVEQLIKARADVNAKMPSSGQTALHVAATVGDVGVLRVLLAAVDEAVMAEDSAGFTPLHLACHCGHIKLVEMLLHARASPDGASAQVPSPLTLASGCGKLTLATESGPAGAASSYLEIVKVLIDANASIQSAGPMHAAASVGELPLVEELANRGVSVDQIDDSGCSPLLAALLKGSAPRTGNPGPQAQAARALLKLGAPADARRECDGLTGLMLAAALGDEGLLEELLSGGADVHAARRSLGSSAVMAGQVEDWKVFDALLTDVAGTSMALPSGVNCPRGHPMERLAKSRCYRRPHCDLCGRAELQTWPVFWTCWACDHDLCIQCARLPPVVCLPSCDTALEAMPESLRSDLQTSAFQRTTLDGWQALHYAVAGGTGNIAQTLLRARADAVAADSQGTTPLHVAAFLGNGCVRVLLEHEASPSGEDAPAAAQVHDAAGRVPLALMPVEYLRWAFCSEELGFAELCSDVIAVRGSGPADGSYLREQATMDRPAGEDGGSTQGSGLPHVPPASPPPPPPVPAPQDDGTSAQASPSTKPRPVYRACDGKPFLVKWSEGSGWGIYQIVPQEVMIFHSTRDTQFCPSDGWKPSEHLPLDRQTEVFVEEAAPYRWGSLLLKSTPAELRPSDLKEKVSALPPFKSATQAVRRPGVVQLPQFHALLEGMAQQFMAPLGVAGGQLPGPQDGPNGPQCQMQ